MNADEQIAEQYARLTEDYKSLDASERTTDTSKMGAAVLQKVIRAYAGLHSEKLPAATTQSEFTWGHLEVLERLGSGSFGEVFRAFDRTLERDVALKLRSGDELNSRAYILEARRLARVRHPNVLAVHGAAIHDGRAGLWADLIHGQTLREWVIANGPRSKQEVLAAGQMLSSALAAVHQVGLIHGDVKPGNIMRAEDGNLVLMDFGAATEHQSAGVHSTFGTLLIMAPEQVKGARIGTAVDMYALGVVLYFLATGEYPLQAASVTELSALHAKSAPINFAPLQQNVGKPFADLIRKLLAYSPDDRPDANATAQVLNNIEQAPARRRKRWAVASIGAALSIALLVSLVALWRVNAEQAAAELAHARESNVRGFLSDFINAPRPGMRGANARVVDVLEDAVPDAEVRFKNDPLALAATLSGIGESLASTGAARKAMPLMQRAVELAQQHAMREAELLSLQFSLARVESQLAGAKANPQTLLDLLERCKQVLGDAHSTTLRVAIEVAQVYDLIGNQHSSEPLLNFVLAHRPVENYAGNPQRLMALVRLSSLLSGQQRWDEVDAILPDALAEAIAEQGESGAHTLALRSTQATIASQRGQHSQAERLLAALIADTEKQYGSKHPNFQALLSNLAISQRMQGKLTDAISNLNRVIALKKDELGENHSAVLSMQENLASALYDAGDSKAALALREKNLVIILDAMGARHPQALIATINLAEQLADEGDSQRGYELASQAIVDATAVFGDKHLFTLEAREVAARAQLKQGKVKSALQALAAICPVKRATLGAEDPYTLRCAGFLAQAHADMGDKPAAIALLRPTIAALEKTVEKDQPDLRRLRSQLAALQN